jgi:ubiquinone/menaquinone biosynthesis C-methylase UbiE
MPNSNAPIENQKSAVKNPPTHWGEVAGWYDQLVGDEGSEFHQKVIFPGVLKMLDAPANSEVVDIACGQGAFCRQLLGKGYRPTGVDAAKTLIHAARDRGPESIPYIMGDARELWFLPEGRFAAAVCILAIQNIDPIASVFAGAARALAAGGKLVVVMMHPCFRGPKYTSWGWDEAEKAQYRRVDRYLLPRKEPIVTHPGKKTGEYTWSFHRPIQAYVAAMRKAGLMVDAIEEWESHKTSTSGPRAAAENTARREIPMFMAIRGVRMGR